MVELNLSAKEVLMGYRISSRITNITGLGNSKSSVTKLVRLPKKIPSQEFLPKQLTYELNIDTFV